MRRPSESEEAALKAASFFSECDTEIESKMNRVRPKKHQKPQTKVSWDGWYFDNEELVDNAGNRYGQCEIRAIFYSRQIINHLREEVRRLSPATPPEKREPEQLGFPFGPMYTWVVGGIKKGKK